jgi:hypothetical protein
MAKCTTSGIQSFIYGRYERIVHFRFQCHHYNKTSKLYLVKELFCTVVILYKVWKLQLM